MTDPGIEVYDVDRQTGAPNFEGLAPIPLKFISVVPSADDHFVYVYGSNTLFGPQSFYVYATDATGMLLQPAIQKFSLPARVGNFVVHPNGRFGYAVTSKHSNGETSAGILLFTLDPRTGRVIGSPKLVATYPRNGLCGSGWSVTGSLGLVGFNSRGDRLYDAWFCSSHDTSGGYYYTRRLNEQTGSLGPDTPTLRVGGSMGSFSAVQFTPHVIVDDYVSADYYENTVNVYPLTGGTTPLFTCTTTMLVDCGQSYGLGVEPSGEYIFFYTLSGNTDIAKLNLPEKEIVGTGLSFPNGVSAFSPDSAVIYSEASYTSPWIFPIYTFDLATGVAARGGQIVVQNSQFVEVVPAIRNMKCLSASTRNDPATRECDDRSAVAIPSSSPAPR